MNILLVYPEMPDTIGKFKQFLKLTGRKSAFPPIGLLTVAAMLPADWNKKLVDTNCKKLTQKDLKWADYVFLSAMNVQAKSVFEIIKICNDEKVKVVAGGPLFTHEYEKFEGVDHFVLNEAEITLPEFLKDLGNGNAKHIYKSSQFANVIETPAPLWELLDLDNYIYSIVQYSRGCPYLCDFCDVTALFGRVPRVKSPGQIINELDILVKSGRNEMIFFADDNLIGNKNVLKKELLPALIEWRSRNKYAPTFATQLTINLADDDELIQLLLEAGFRHILIGIESIDEEALANMRKKQNTRRDLLENLKKLQEKGFIIIGTFIVGLDDDKESVFENVAKFIQDSGIVLVVINVLKAPPGTELYERMKREERLLENFKFDEDKTNIIPKMDPETLHYGYKFVLGEAYSAKNVFERSIVHFKMKKKFKVKNPLRRKIHFSDIVSFLRIVLFMGILNSECKYFWMLFKYAYKNHQNYIDLALLYSLIMYEYNKLYEKFVEREKEGEFIYPSEIKQKLAKAS
ncbi:MAG: B12-binding domain-containing radical SAM protein [Ignavibacteria bacterium]|jgi:radical SAM superfamily enzyme YgiQ (UPF0313 family)